MIQCSLLLIDGLTGTMFITYKALNSLHVGDKLTLQFLDTFPFYKFFHLFIVKLDYNDKRSIEYQMFHVLIFLFIQIGKTISKKL